MKKGYVLLLLLCTFISSYGRNVIVTVSPSQGAIVLDQKNASVSGADGVFTIPVSIVSKSYAVKAEGYDSQTFVITTKSPNSMKIELKPNIKNVTIEASVPDAKIVINGEERGTGSANVKIRKDQRLGFSIYADGYDTYKGSISFHDQPGITMNFPIELVANRRDVTVQLANGIDNATFLVDGKEVAKGTNKASFSISRGETVILAIKCPGYVDYTTQISFSDGQSFYNLANALSEDEAFSASVEGAEIANKNIIIEVGSKMSRDEVYRKLKMYLSDVFETSFDVSDSDVGWARTIWVQRVFNTRRVRTRAEIKELPDSKPGALLYKLYIQSQWADPRDDKADDESFKPWDRVLKKYSSLPETIKNAVGGR